MKKKLLAAIVAALHLCSLFGFDTEFVAAGMAFALAVAELCE